MIGNPTYKSSTTPIPLTQINTNSIEILTNPHSVASCSNLLNKLRSFKSLSLSLSQGIFRSSLWPLWFPVVIFCYLWSIFYLLKLLAKTCRIGSKLSKLIQPCNKWGNVYMYDHYYSISLKILFYFDFFAKGFFFIPKF